ncbi:MAG: DUF4111 domain-containing protein [Candidatus Portnoybacteria bacterium]|nr:DUF4111 domain-containing protein [Candidatus Portnoybacteria bacterium]
MLESEIRLKLLGLTEEIEKLVNDNFTGAYLHGSLAMDCFNPKSSDIDFLVVVKRSLAENEKDEIGNLLLKYQKNLPNKLEAAIIANSIVKDFKYPPRYELYFPDENGGYKKDGSDPDLTADFVILNKRGVVIKGKSIAEVFSNISENFYLKSILNDFEWSFNNVLNGPDEGKCKIPVYAVLNFCRIIGFLKTKSILSKKEGGEWGLGNLPPKFGLLIEGALKEYAKVGSSQLVDAKLLKDFANYTRAELR